jgi:VWFA-related protein
MKRSRTTLSQPHEHTRSEADRRQLFSRRFLRPLWLALATFVMAAIVSGPVFADVKLRVEARPITDPINVFVTVTNGNDSETPVAGLDDTDFTVLVDGVEVVSPTFSLSPIQDAEQQVSIVFAMDYSTSTTEAQPAMEQAVLTFLGAMEVGDYAAIIKFNETNTQRVAVLQPFTMIDNASGSSALEGAVKTPYLGSGSPVVDAIEAAVQQFVSPPVPLPAGPKVVILVSDGGDNTSVFTGGPVVTAALNQGISVFTVGVGPLDELVSERGLTGRQLLQEFAFQTGGQYYEAPDDQAIEDAYNTIATLLQNEYLLTFESNITDCNVHVVEVRVTGFDPATSTFTRCNPPSTSPTPTPTPPPEGDVGGTPLPPPSDDGNGGGGGGGGTPDGSGGGGGGGAFGPLGLIAGLSLLALRRRLLVA